MKSILRSQEVLFKKKKNKLTKKPKLKLDVSKIKAALWRPLTTGQKGTQRADGIQGKVDYVFTEGLSISRLQIYLRANLPFYWRKHLDSLFHQQPVIDDYVCKASPCALRCNWHWAAPNLRDSEEKIMDEDWGNARDALSFSKEPGCLVRSGDLPFWAQWGKQFWRFEMRRKKKKKTRVISKDSMTWVLLNGEIIYCNLYLWEFSDVLSWMQCYTPVISPLGRQKQENC